MPRVLISDKLEASGLDVLRAAGLELDERSGLKDNDLQEALRAAEGVIVRSGTQITAKLLDKPGKLRVIVRAGVGVDNIDVPAATRKGIVVMNTPGGNTVSTCEHTIAMLLALCRHIPKADASMKQGVWDRKLVGSQLAGKTIGIIGLGRIGREIARRLMSFEVKVIGYDPLLSVDKVSQLGIEGVADYKEMLPRVDFLTVHTPLNDKTRNLIGAAEIVQMKKGARLLNCARGGIINEEALIEGLKSGHLAGAALDVYLQEPPPADHPLLKAPNLVLTPHLGASTVEAQTSVALEAAQLIVDYLTKGIIGFAVNMATIDRAELDEVRLYVDMARRLGLMHAQMCEGAIQRAELSYRGEVGRRSTKLITGAFTAGLLESRLDQNVNIVNAELLARERGIEIVEQSSGKKGDFSTLIKADVFTDKKQYTAAATLFGNQYLRLVQLGPYHLDTYMDGTMLIFTHRDVPGIIGMIGTIFGRHKVNIAQMTVGRQLPGGEAIGVLNLDSLPSEEAVNEVRSQPQITSVTMVQLPPAGAMPSWF